MPLRAPFTEGEAQLVQFPAGLQFTDLEFECAVVESGIDHVRGERRSTGISLHGALVFSLTPQRITEIGIERGHLRIDAQCAAEAIRCLIQAQQLAEDDAEIVQGNGIVGLDAERDAVLLDRFFQLVLIAQNRAEIVVRFGIVPLEPGGLAKAGIRLVQLLLRLVIGAGAVVRLGVFGIGFQRQPNQPQRLVDLAAVHGDQTQMMQRG